MSSNEGMVETKKGEREEERQKQIHPLTNTRTRKHVELFL